MSEPVFKRPGSKFWQIRYTNSDHREVRISSGTEDYGKACELHTALTQGKGLNLIDLAEQFFDNKQMSAKTSMCYRTSYRAWFDCIGSPKLEFIDHDLIRVFIAKRIKVVAESTIRNDLAFMSSLFRFAMMLPKGPKSNPVRSFDKSFLSTSDTRVRYLQPRQLTKLLSVIKVPHRQLIVLFGTEAGLRKSEILSLRVEQIRLWQRYILLKGEDTKTKKGRRVPMSRTLIRAVCAHLRANPALRRDQSSYLILNPDTKTRYREVRPWWDNALKKAGITDFTFHDTRHHFASTYVQRGGRLQPLSRILGHTTTQMTEKYAHIADKDAADEFHALMNSSKRAVFRA